MLSNIILSSRPLNKEYLKLGSLRALGLSDQGKKIHINIFFTAEKKLHWNCLWVNFAKNTPEELFGD